MASGAIPAVRASAAASEARVQPLAAVRLAFVDNIRILLVALVIVHHLAVTYGAEGSWYYYERPADAITAMVLTLFVAVNQAFFMGFYFAIAAYFAAAALDRRPVSRFLLDRFLRLGVPLAFQLLVMGPLLSYGLGVTLWGFDGSLWAYLLGYVQGYRGLDSGPLWFVEALLLFSVVYALWWWLSGPSAGWPKVRRPAPGDRAIAAFALGIGLVTFVVRIWLPVGWAFAPLNFQLPHFPQYIGLFVFGAAAYRRGWLSALSEDAARGRRWSRVVLCLVVIAPALFVLGGALQGNTEPFRGGLHWQALAYAVWEQFMCVGLIIGLLTWFLRRQNRQGRVARGLSASAYAVYILHTPILVAVSLGLKDVALHPLLKFALTALICVPACFGVGVLVRRLPHVADVV